MINSKTYTIKPLEWVEDPAIYSNYPRKIFYAYTRFGGYMVSKHYLGAEWGLANSRLRTIVETIDEGKAAAEADWIEAMESCLEVNE